MKLTRYGAALAIPALLIGCGPLLNLTQVRAGGAGSNGDSGQGRSASPSPSGSGSASSSASPGASPAPGTSAPPGSSAGAGNAVPAAASLTGAAAVFAGVGTQGYLDGAAAQAQFANPYGVAIDVAGNLYVGDTTNNRIRKISNGTVTTVAGTGTAGTADGPAASATFNNPCFVAIGPDGTLYVADNLNCMVRKISGGTVSRWGGTGSAGHLDGPVASAQFGQVVGIAVDGASNVYVADRGHYIRKISAAGVVSTVAGNGIQGVVDGTGTNAEVWDPRGICVDAGGNVFFTDVYCIRKLTPAGVVTTFAGVGGGSPAHQDGTGASAGFGSLCGLIVDAASTLYAVDAYGSNDYIRTISAGGVVTTIAGGPNGYANGPGTSAAFNNAQQLALDSSGTLYVADAGNHRIRTVR